MGPLRWRLPLLSRSLLLLLLVGTALGRANSAAYKYVVRIHDFKNCDDSPGYATIHTPVIVLGPDTAHLTSVNCTVTKPIQKINSLSIRLTRCREALSANTCEYFTTWSWKSGVCGMLPMKNMFWTPVVNTVTPQLRCPLKAGMYTANNATWDVNSPVLNGIIDGYIMVGRVTLTDQDDNIFICGWGAISRARVRVKP